jgi:hypothetical protein
VTGEPWAYTSWATQYGFPDNYGGNQDYAKFAAGPYWDDLQNDPSTGQSGVDGILVEYEAVPEPGCLALLGVGGITLLRHRGRDGGLWIRGRRGRRSRSSRRRLTVMY